MHAPGECEAPYKKSATGTASDGDRGRKEARLCPEGLRIGKLRTDGGTGSKKEEEDKDAAEENNPPFAGAKTGPGAPDHAEIEERRAESEDTSFLTDLDEAEDEGSPAGKGVQGMKVKRSRDESYEAESLLGGETGSADADLSGV